MLLLRLQFPAQKCVASSLQRSCRSSAAPRRKSENCYRYLLPLSFQRWSK